MWSQFWPQFWPLWSDVAVPAFATLFVIIDPLGLVPIFMALTANMDAKTRRATAWRATIFAFAVLLVFALAGQAVLKFLGISIAAFQIAGGLLLFLTALEMLFEKRADRRQKNVDQSSIENQSADDPPDDQWVFPLGTPLIAGPGAIASIILLMNSGTQGIAGQAVVIGVLFGVIVMTLILFLIAGRLGRFVGPTASRAMSRVLGMILAALAVQFVLTGLSSAGFGG
ncbi:MarC family integral membrane protein [hydrothermal vent metagenome]|uniref:MarC family integral membrane protein n=1 Tax=hydrothermal vent metagenome TaxID=652676 RepID=A0A3B0R4W8_9ZZZZ